ncbi:TIGR00282 family metallophosphoesterase [Patescibacteria group bacterium]
MKILFIGDIIGRPGRDTVKKILPSLKEKYFPDLTIANGENLTHGRGISEETVNDMIRAGVDFFTTGNHVYANKQGAAKLDDRKFPVIRPANFPPGNPGRGFQLFETAKMQKVLVVNLMGRVFMKHNYDCPFRTIDAILDEHKLDNPEAIIVDIHADATSEKTALAHYLDGRVTAVIGTHTHVPTADSRILEEGTAYITDVGMVGLSDSIIGVDKEPIIRNFLTQMPVKHEFGDGPTTFNAVLIETEGNTKKAESIELIIEQSDNS